MSAEKTADQKQKRRWLRRAEPEVEEEQVLDKGMTAAKGRVTPGRRNTDEDEDEGNIVTRSAGGIREYVEGVRSELSKVSWPTREETRRLSVLVIITTILSSIALGLISLGFTELFRLGLATPGVFAIFFLIVGAIAFFIYRRNSGSDVSPY